MRNYEYRLKEIYGTFLMQDIAASSHVHKNIDHPVGPLLYSISVMHCMTVSLAGNGAGLGTMWSEEKAREMLQEEGFTKLMSEIFPMIFRMLFTLSKRSRRILLSKRPYSQIQ